MSKLTDLQQAILLSYLIKEASNKNLLKLANEAAKASGKGPAPNTPANPTSGSAPAANEPAPAGDNKSWWGKSKDWLNEKYFQNPKSLLVSNIIAALGLGGLGAYQMYKSKKEKRRRAEEQQRLMQYIHQMQQRNLMNQLLGAGLGLGGGALGTYLLMKMLSKKD